jgi:hypothetical protein
VEPRVVTRRTIALVAAGVVGVLVVVLVVLQLALPGIAEDKVRGEVGDDAATVSVRASPVMKLLFGKADAVTVHTPTVAADADAPLGELFKRAKDVGRTDATVGRIQVQGLTLRNVHAVVQGDRVQAEASLSIKELQTLVPGGGTLRALPPGADGEPRFAVSVGLLGISTTVNATVAPVDGAVQVAADGLPVSITVFQDPSVAVDAVRGRATGDTLRITFSGALT